MSQPFHVAETYSGYEGKYVALSDTIHSFREILDGNLDDAPEECFFMKGAIEEVYEHAERLKQGTSAKPAQ
jgi:F-type H+-transporting ATPase subunit beta